MASLWSALISGRARTFSLVSVQFCALLMMATAVHAQVTPDPAWLRDVQQFTLKAARHQTPGQRIEVHLGALDPRLRLAPCERAEPYLPGVARLWGRSRIGLRCAQGPSAWNVFVPVTIKVFGPAYVAAAALPVGRVITPVDLIQAEVDLAEDPSSPITDPARALGRAVVRPLSSGQAMRQAHLKVRQWFAAGDEVKVLARGEGFQAAGVAQALTPGIEGQVARVKTESGRILIGLPVAQGTIALTL